MSPAGPKDWAPRPLPIGDESVQRLLARIRTALWTADLAKAFPEATGGDFPPDASFKWNREMEDAVLTWLSWNLPLRRQEALNAHFSAQGRLPDRRISA